ncbi:gp30 domain protein [Burkholderia pseudomallei MSHR7504]|nr:gp30 domain protein [Burkholderia pseudomallei MSHR7504]
MNDQASVAQRFAHVPVRRQREGVGPAGGAHKVRFQRDDPVDSLDLSDQINRTHTHRIADVNSWPVSAGVEVLARFVRFSSHRRHVDGKSGVTGDRGQGFAERREQGLEHAGPLLEEGARNREVDHVHPASELRLPVRDREDGELVKSRRELVLRARDLYYAGFVGGDGLRLVGKTGRFVERHGLLALGVEPAQRTVFRRLFPERAGQRLAVFGDGRVVLLEALHNGGAHGGRVPVAEIHDATHHQRGTRDSFLVRGLVHPKRKGVGAARVRDPCLDFIFSHFIVPSRDQRR